jgi:hypothetical protein
MHWSTKTKLPKSVSEDTYIKWVLRFAILPVDIEGTTIWLERYWEKFCYFHIKGIGRGWSRCDDDWPYVSGPKPWKKLYEDKPNGRS